MKQTKERIDALDKKIAIINGPNCGWSNED